MSDLTARLSEALADRYAIERELGEGGMATVYLAEDLKHKRRVAIKLLKPELAAVVGAERFLAEIETTANLQHPHILPLYDSGEANGFLFYVMPFTEGESLRDKLEREKQLSVDEAVGIARAVASALDYAHRNDVVHRDIKPENILLHDGQPVVADFGIALAVSAAGGHRLTETGMSVGTPHYMSPEQAMGDREVDARSDLYSLACVTYEMLVGDPPHTGSTAQAVVARVLTEKPQRITEQRDTVPRHVDQTIRKALEKLPADRFATAADFAGALDNPAATASMVAARGPDAQRPSAPRRLTPAVGFVVVTAAALGYLLGQAGGGPAGDPGPSARFTFDIIRGTVARGATVALSGDGADLVYIGVGEEGRSQLFRRPLNVAEATPIAGTSGNLVELPFLSPDGQTVGFYAEQQLRTVPVGGGTARILAAMGPTGRGLTWTPGDLIVYNARSESGLLGVDADLGGEPRELTTVDEEAGEVGHWWPHALPDGEHVLFTVWRGAAESPVIAVLSLETGEIRELLPGHTPSFVDPGYLVYGSPEGELRVVPFDAERLEIEGSPVTLVADAVQGSGGGVADYSVSRNGVLAYMNTVTSTVPVIVDAEGGITAVPQLEPGYYQAPRFSPDGDRFVTGYRNEVWVYDFVLGTFSPLTVAGTRAFYPLWTPDGDTVVFSRTEGADVNVYSVPADLGQEPVALFVTPGQQRTQDLSPDGRWLLLRETTPEGYDLRALSLGEGEMRTWLESGALERAPTFSPDGRWVAFSSDESGRNEVYVRPFPGPGGRIPVSTNGGAEPAWSFDGRRLFFRSGDRFEAVDVETAPTFRALSRPVTVFEGRFHFYPWQRQWDVHPDGDRFLVLRAEQEESEVAVVVNFLREVEGESN